MEHMFKGYAIAKIEYGGWGDAHPCLRGMLLQVFPTREDAAHWAHLHGYNLAGNNGYSEYGIISVDINPGEYELKES